MVCGEIPLLVTDSPPCSGGKAHVLGNIPFLYMRTCPMLPSPVTVQHVHIQYVLCCCVCCCLNAVHIAQYMYYLSTHSTPCSTHTTFSPTPLPAVHTLPFHLLHSLQYTHYLLTYSTPCSTHTTFPPTPLPAVHTLPSHLLHSLQYTHYLLTHSTHCSTHTTFSPTLLPAVRTLPSHPLHSLQYTHCLLTHSTPCSTHTTSSPQHHQHHQHQQHQQHHQHPCSISVNTTSHALPSHNQCPLLPHACRAFKQFLELEPQIRELVQQFHNSKYAWCLKILDEMKVRCLFLCLLTSA